MMKIFAILSVLVSAVFCYRTGAPEAACVQMFPIGHESNSMDSTSTGNFSIDVSFSQSGAINLTGVVVTVSSTDNQVFNGVFLQARRANCSGSLNDEAIGTYELMPGEMKLKLVQCTAMNNAVTHREPLNSTSFTVSWNAPTADVGPIYFRATVVRSLKMFWTNITSDIYSQVGAPAMGEKCPVMTDKPTSTVAPTTTTESGAKAHQSNHLVITVCVAYVYMLLYKFYKI